MKIISRKEAKSLGLKRYYTGKPCKHGHVAERHAHNAVCVECQQQATQSWHSANSSYMKNYNKQYYKDNDEVIKQRSMTYYNDNIETQKEKHKQHYYNNIDQYKDRMAKWRKQNGRQWRQNNKASINSWNAKRRAIVKQQTPQWADDSAIKLIYEQCVSISNESGIQHNVDHIVPLRGKLVCGLHCESNLQIIPAHDNFVKHNSHDVDVPCYEFDTSAIDIS